MNKPDIVCHSFYSRANDVNTDNRGVKLLDNLFNQGEDDVIINKTTVDDFKTAIFKAGYQYVNKSILNNEISFQMLRNPKLYSVQVVQGRVVACYYVNVESVEERVHSQHTWKPSGPAIY